MFRIEQIDSLDRLAEMLKCIGHPVKLGILQILGKEMELTVSEIHDNLQTEVEQPMLSHHLSKMKDKGLLLSTKEGKYIKYRISDTRINQLFDVFPNIKK